jgi:hypothetical protein
MADRRALLVTKDLFFRAKLSAALEQSGYTVSLCGTAPVAVIELGTPNASARIERLIAEGARVVAFGSHLKADELRGAREAGATAVPNSEIERTIREELTPSS